MTQPKSNGTSWYLEHAVVTKFVEVENINKALETCDKEEWRLVSLEVSQMAEQDKNLEFFREATEYLQADNKPTITNMALTLQLL